MLSRKGSMSAFFAISFVAGLWGLSFLSTKVLLTELPPMRIAFTRFLIASIILGILLNRLEPKSRIRKADWTRLALVGFLGTTLYFIFENSGLKYTSASNAVLIIATIPAFTIGLEGIFYRTKIRPTTLVGVIISIAGVASVVGPETLDLASSKAIGNLLVLGAALSWVAFNEASKPMFSRYTKLALTTYTTWFGTAFLLPLTFLEKAPLHLPTPNAWLHLAYLALLCSAAGYFLYMYALDKLGTTTVTSFLNLTPIVGVAGSVLFLHESLSVAQIIGGIVILGGITLVGTDPVGKGESDAETKAVA